VSDGTRIIGARGKVHIVPPNHALQASGICFVHTLTTLCLQELGWVDCWEPHQRAHHSVPNLGFSRFEATFTMCYFPKISMTRLSRPNVSSAIDWQHPFTSEIDAGSSFECQDSNNYLVERWYLSIYPSQPLTFVHSASLAVIALADIILVCSEHCWSPHRPLPLAHQCCWR
jgi:hypothetical protein